MLDALSKYLITRELGPDSTRESIDVVSGVITLGYSRNTGVAFGLLSGESWPVWIAVSLGYLIGCYVVAVAMRDAQMPMIVGLALCAGGAVGNLLDRLWRGYVVDFIEIGPWPSFNLADAALTCGLLIIVGGQLLSAKRTAAAS